MATVERVTHHLSAAAEAHRRVHAKATRAARERRKLEGDLEAEPVPQTGLQSPVADLLDLGPE